MVKADPSLLPSVVLFVCFGSNTRVSAESCSLVTGHGSFGEDGENVPATGGR